MRLILIQIQIVLPPAVLCRASRVDKVAGTLALIHHGWPAVRQRALTALASLAQAYQAFQAEYQTSGVLDEGACQEAVLVEARFYQLRVRLLCTVNPVLPCRSSTRASLQACWPADDRGRM